MPPVVVFEIRGSIAHFRRPDTLGNHASYPFIPRTALRGLIAAVLGLEGPELLPEDVRCGVQLLSAVRTVVQELSLHGKKWMTLGTNDSFHRPTSIELVVNPHYRIFCTGSEVANLSDRLKRQQSVYHTYLGSAFCLTVPEWRQLVECEPVAGGGMMKCATVVPAPAIGHLDLAHGRGYARVGGVSLAALGGRRYRGTTAVVYDRAGGPLAFQSVVEPETAFWGFYRLPDDDGVFCLW